MSKVTGQMVKVSIGLRSPELYPDTMNGIMKIPFVFKEVLIEYFKHMNEKGLITNHDYEGMAMQFLSMNVGFVFLKASFDDRLSEIGQKDYIQSSVNRFICGIW